MPYPKENPLIGIGIVSILAVMAVLLIVGFVAVLIVFG